VRRREEQVAVRKELAVLLSPGARIAELRARLQGLKEEEDSDEGGDFF
jgi:hypothetical protein